MRNIKRHWENILKNYIQANSSSEPEDLNDVRNAAAEYARIFGNKNRTIPLDNSYDYYNGTTWYPVDLVKEVEPNKWKLLLKYLNSDNEDAPSYRN